MLFNQQGQGQNGNGNGNGNENPNPSTSSENKESNGNILMIAHEVKVIKRLSCNQESIRLKQLRRLKKWYSMRARSPTYVLTSEEFVRMWKGLYVCMWMSDKPLVQENTAEEISSLVDSFNNYKLSVIFFCAFYKTMFLEWFGIDQWRLDKFLMLVRRMVRQTFTVLKNEQWSTQAIKHFNSEVFTCLQANYNPGLLLHYLDVYLEELAKVSEGKVSAKTVCRLIRPFVRFACVNQDYRILAAIRSKIFMQLLWQSDMGREYVEKFNAWKEMGFPTSSLQELIKVEYEEELAIPNENDEEISDEEANHEEINDEEANDEEINHDEINDEEINDEEANDEENSENVLDPRAGDVDVFMPVLPVDPLPIINEIKRLLFISDTSPPSRKFMHAVLKKYEIFASGKFPLGIHSMYKPDLEPMSELIDKKLKSLEKLDKELHGTTRQLKKINKQKRKRFLSSIEVTDKTNEDNYEELLQTQMKSYMKNNKKQKLSKVNEWTEEALSDSDETDSEQSMTSNNEFEEEEIQASRKARTDQLRKQVANKLKNFTSKSNCKVIKKVEIWDASLLVPNPVSPIVQMTNKSPVKIEDENSEEGQIQKPNEEKLDSNKKDEAKMILSRKFVNKTVIWDPSTLVPNPYARKIFEPKKKIDKKQRSLNDIVSSTRTPTKKVQIVLDRNTAQKASEYIKQVKNSPQLPYNPKKQPTKSVLKPNLLPSPINPFFKKKMNEEKK